MVSMMLLCETTNMIIGTDIITTVTALPTPARAIPACALQSLPDGLHYLRVRIELYFHCNILPVNSCFMRLLCPHYIPNFHQKSTPLPGFFKPNNGALNAFTIQISKSAMQKVADLSRPLFSYINTALQ